MNTLYVLKEMAMIECIHKIEMINFFDLYRNQIQ